MSYILEALKKSQRDRELGQVPDLKTETFADAPENESAISPWIIGAVVMALLALLVALYAVFGHHMRMPETARPQVQDPILEPPQLIATQDPKVQEQARASTPAHETVPPVRVKTKPTPAATDDAIVAKPVSTIEKRPAPAPLVDQASVEPSTIDPVNRQSEVERIRIEYARMQAQEKQLAQKPKPVTPRQQEPRIETAADNSTTKPAMPVAAASPSIHELPADVQSRIPSRNIMLQSYSDNPKQRFVILNSTKLYQGQTTADGLQVLEIRVDGLLFGFEGHRFFQPR